MQLETNLVREQENQVKELMRRIEKLESETTAKQSSLEQVSTMKVPYMYQNLKLIMVSYFLPQKHLLELEVKVAKI